jgi:endonuclease YncB( thermonuclease family)
VETDDYGRTVGLLYQGGRHVNLAMIATGNAWWYRYYAPHERQFEAAETAARERRIGLWRDDRPIPPWDWRRGRR